MKERFQSILSKATDSLEAAKLLAEQGYYDFSASRAYYVMFYAAEALLLARGLSFSSHAATIANYGKEYSKTGDMDRKFHKYLIAVQDLRSQGDYSYGPGVSASHAKEALSWAAEFLEAATAYLENE
ncbi:MAG: hypothetical protein B6I38_03815 [Anaerolineaceae bacterium 4572_5.1]|nr:MAG: hypothetical protein B6I38_03815 [Anaerolineaceae bacterium 4572_5.1]